MRSDKKREKIFAVLTLLDDGEYHLLDTWRYRINHYDPHTNKFIQKNKNIVKSNKVLSKFFSTIKNKEWEIDIKKITIANSLNIFYRLVKIK